MDKQYQDTLQPIKISFGDICSQLKLYNGGLNVIHWMSGVPSETFGDMLVGDPVQRDHAENVLIALSLYIDSNWTLETVDVPLLEDGKEIQHGS
jgi:hypothetical protein